MRIGDLSHHARTRPNPSAGRVRPASPGHPGWLPARRRPPAADARAWPTNSAWRGRPWCWPTSAWRPRAMSARAPAAAPMSPPTCRTPPLRPAAPAGHRRQRPVAARHRAGRHSGHRARRAISALGHAAGRRPAGARPVSRRRLGALRRARAEGAAGRSAPAIRRRRACTTCARRSPRISRPPAGWLADPGCIVVTAGTQQALRIAAELLLDPGDPAWVEDPGYIAGRGALLVGRRRARAGAE